MNISESILGNRFGRLIVLGKLRQYDNKDKYKYICLCDCGKYIITRQYNLKRGATTSCGCYGKEQRVKATYKNIVGKKFGRWFVIKRVENNGKRTMYLCRCDCGTERVVGGESILSGNSSSCGCFRLEKIKKNAGDASFTNLYLRYKNSAAHRQLEFHISKKEFKEITSSNCYYCGNPPEIKNKKPEFKNGLYTYNGIDRINNDLGYIEGNIVTCCKNCNKAKQTMTFNEFINWVKKIYDNLKEKRIIQ